MKQELRCHGVLCSSEAKAKTMATKLQERLHQALIDFRKEKISRQNARLSLANTIYDNPTMPQRKILLHTGSINYRPPISRGRSAPKLHVIEEGNLEEDQESRHEVPDVAESSDGTSLVGEERCDTAILHDAGVSTPFTEEDVGNTEEENDESEICSGTESLACSKVHTEDEDNTISFRPMNKEHKRLTNSITRRDHLSNEALVSGSDYLSYIAEEDEKSVLTTFLGNSSADEKSLTKTATTEAVSCDFASRKKDDPLEMGSSSNTPTSKRFSTFPGIKLGSVDDDDHHTWSGEALNDPLPGKLISMIKVTEQDILSDESGYSDESTTSTAHTIVSNATVMSIHHKNTVINKKRPKNLLSGKTTFVLMNSSELDDQNHKEDGSKKVESSRTLQAGDEKVASSVGEEDSPCDLTVHSAVISDMSMLERRRYLDRITMGALSTYGKEFLRNNRLTDLCINI